MLRPFGPRIGHVKCPSFVIDRLIEITDDLIKNKDYESAGKHLVGIIEDEPHIQIEEEKNLYEFFNGILRHYVHSVLEEFQFLPPDKLAQCTLATGIKDMWSVHMKPNEYNPLHHHTFCNVSSVLYLKVPNNESRNIPNKTERDGNITVVDHTSWPESLDNGVYEIKPEVGSMYLWPAHILHTVYPFLGNEERRSVAWNGAFQLSNEDGEILLG